MNNTSITSLHHIPCVLFREFRDPAVEEQVQTFDGVGHVDTVWVCAAAEDGGNGPFTLVYVDHRDKYNRTHEARLFAYGYPVKPEAFSSNSERPARNPILQIIFSAEDPPYTRGTQDNLWEQGKGYWCNEDLAAKYGGFDQAISIASYLQKGDWEFGFLLRLQARAHELACGVASRGHWQSEWDPAGKWLARKAEHFVE